MTATSVPRVWKKELKQKEHPTEAEEVGEVRTGVAEIRSANGSEEFGTIFFVQENENVKISGTLSGISSVNVKHSMRVHEFGTVDCNAAGDPINDLGNFDVNKKGAARIKIVAEAEKFPFAGPKSIIGRTLVLHKCDHDHIGGTVQYCTNLKY